MITFNQLKQCILDGELEWIRELEEPYWVIEAKIEEYSDAIITASDTDDLVEFFVDYGYHRDEAYDKIIQTLLQHATFN